MGRLPARARGGAGMSTEPIDTEALITEPRLALITELLIQLRAELLKCGYGKDYVNRRVCELLDGCVDELYERTK